VIKLGEKAAVAGTKPATARPRIASMTMRIAGSPGSAAGSAPGSFPGSSAGSLAAEVDDSALVALIARRDHDALAVLYQRHGAACQRLARRITASATLADDAVQEAFVGLWRAPAGYRAERGSVRTWLLGLTHHKSVDLVRKETAEQRRQHAQAAEQALEPQVSEDPAAAVWTELRAAEVRSALTELPEVQRHALALAYFGGYTQSQIAVLTNTPLGTVKTRMFNAMQRLRLRLAPLAGVPGDGTP